MATSSEASPTGLLSLEKELVCFICTEVLYQPLTLIDCLHTFCGSCLKEWFSHQHRKATHSRSSSSSNPYTCPTCRATVKDARHNATVSMILETMLTANPGRDRTPEEKQEMSQIYKPGDNILPGLQHTKRREHRHRRDGEDVDSAERRMVNEARERSLREIRRGDGSTQDELTAPTHRQEQSRSREREERRERRREQERAERRRRVEAAEASIIRDQTLDEASMTANDRTSSPPSSSPRHPDAVEARQRERAVAHQASLRSLVSASESSTGTGESLNEARIMQEILAEGLLDGIDVENLTETEQDALSERIAEAYRQRHLRPSQDEPPEDRNNSRESRSQLLPARPSASSRTQDSDQRRRSRSSQRSSHMPTSPGWDRADQLSTAPGENLSPPLSDRSHRRRASDQSRRQTSPAQSSRGPATRSATDLSAVIGVQNTSVERVRKVSDARRAQTEPTQSAVSASEAWRQAGADPQGRELRNSVTEPLSQDDQGPARVMKAPTIVEQGPESENVPPQPPPMTQEQSPEDTSINVTRVLSAERRASRRSSLQEPSIKCFRCSRGNIQYEVHKYCDTCDVDLCLQCYRAGRGCNHWFGFGSAAFRRFSATTTDRGSKLLEPPHVLVSRRYARAAQSGDVITSSTLSPAERLQEGHFCDRCGTFANDCFWTCDICNDGEWGFCNSCVDTHHCCTHPLLPVAHRLFAPQSRLAQPPPDYDLSAVPDNTPNHSRPSTSHSTKTESDYVILSITAECDMCGQDISPMEPRYHCPSHSSSTSTHNLGGYDICSKCYNTLLRSGRIRREDGPSGWRKCPSGHRMIVIVFEVDGIGNQRRVVLDDLVGGWKCSEDDIKAWNATRAQQGTKEGANPDTSPIASNLLTNTSPPSGHWTWHEPSTPSSRKSRTHSTVASTLASGSQNMPNFPPSGGFGFSVLAMWPFYPEEGQAGQGELMFPRHAEVREVEEINDEWWYGVYAGELGVFPAVYVRRPS